MEYKLKTHILGILRNTEIRSLKVCYRQVPYQPNLLGIFVPYFEQVYETLICRELFSSDSSFMANLGDVTLKLQVLQSFMLKVPF